MVVIAKMKAKKGSEGKLEAALKDMVAKVASEEGTLAYTLHRSMSDGTEFLLYEKYTDQDAFSRHSETSHFKELMGITASLLDGPPAVELFEELASL
ncbi:MAG: antibiotic biosynthesis monooxygenase [Deltaproteobacteria bacterium]|nr:antibiotic biosynthesis monooxygenase [Candidatus Zymogenaceae bacterium]